MIDDDYLNNMDINRTIEKNTKFFDRYPFVVAESNNEIIGFCGLDYGNIEDLDDNCDCELRGIYVRPDLKRNGTAGGGIWINENYQKNGYGTEAFCIRNRYIFNELNLRRIENGYFPNNEKSHNMQLKLGYKDEGIKRKRFICMATNEYVDECITDY